MGQGVYGSPRHACNTIVPFTTTASFRSSAQSLLKTFCIKLFNRQDLHFRITIGFVSEHIPSAGWPRQLLALLVERGGASTESCSGGYLYPLDEGKLLRSSS